MKPHTNRAARRKPCKKQASDKNRQESQNNDKFLSNSKSSISYNKNLDSKLSSSDDTLMLPNYLGNIPVFPQRAIPNPYTKPFKPDTNIPNEIQFFLNGDDPIQRQNHKRALSETDDEDSSDTSGYNGGEDISAKPQSLQCVLRPRRHLSQEYSNIDSNSTSSLDIRFKPNKNFRGIQSSDDDLGSITPPLSSSITNHESFIPNEETQIDVSTFPVGKLKIMLNNLSKTSNMSQSQEARDAIKDIFRECDHLENLQIDYKKRQQIINREVDTIQHHQQQSEILLENLQQIQHHPTLYQSDHHIQDPQMAHPSHSATQTFDEYAKIFQPSRFTKLNYADSEASTFLSKPESLSDASPTYCDLGAEENSINHTVCSRSRPSSSVRPPDVVVSPLNLEAATTTADAAPFHDTSISQPFSVQTQDSLVLADDSSEQSSVTSTEPSLECIASIPLAHLSRGPSLVSQRQYDSPQEKHDTDIRIMFQNCRGAFPVGTPQNEHYVPSMTSFRNMMADAVLLSETNTDWRMNDNAYNAQLLNRAQWRPHPTKTSTASCKWENTSRTSFQTGGVLSLFLNALPSRITSSESDKYGRWTRTTFQLKKQKLVI